MSRLQDQAKPFMEQMIQGYRITIGHQAQKVLAAWATMTAMVLDFSEVPMPGPMFSQHQRTAFYRDHRIPSGIAVWLAQQEKSDSAAGWWIDGVSIGLKSQPRPSIDGYNLYLNTAIFGHLVLQLLIQRYVPGIPPDLSRLPAANVAWRDKHVRLRMLPPQVAVTWPPPLPLQEAELEGTGRDGRGCDPRYMGRPWWLIHDHGHGVTTKGWLSYTAKG
jgi:hypothetical protein